MNLVKAAEVMERLQRRAATPAEVGALKAARDALLIIVSEGFSTMTERIRAGCRNHQSGTANSGGSAGGSLSGATQVPGAAPEARLLRTSDEFLHELSDAVAVDCLTGEPSHHRLHHSSEICR